LLHGAPIAARVAHLAVREMPGSASPAELLRACEIDAAAIVGAVRNLVARSADLEAPTSMPLVRRCYVCGSPASWRVALGAEDEPGEEQDACQEHAAGQQRLHPLEKGAELRRTA
jgi:transketolase